MGSAASTPLNAWSTDELASAVEGLGGSGYAQTAATIREHGVDGGTVASEEDISDILEEVDASKLQKKRLAHEFKRMKGSPMKDDKVRIRNFKRAAKMRPWSCCETSDLQAWLAHEVIATAPEDARPELRRLAAGPLRGATGIDLLAKCTVQTEHPPFCKFRQSARGDVNLIRSFKISTIRIVEQALLDRGYPFYFALWQASRTHSMLLGDFEWKYKLGNGAYGEVHCVRNKHTRQLRALKLVRVAQQQHLSDDEEDDTISEDEIRESQVVDDNATCDEKDTLLDTADQILFVSRRRKLKRKESPTRRLRKKYTRGDRRIEAECAAIEQVTAEMAAQQRAAAASEFVVKIDAWGSFGEAPSTFVYSIMELCPNTLADIIEPGVGISDENRRMKLYAQLAIAVRDLHAADMIHLDIKPQNILLAANGDVRLADLGLATEFDTEHTTQRSKVGGTRLYSAPEVQTGQYSNKADIYSLALVFFQMAVGELPNLNVLDMVEPLRKRRCNSLTIDLVTSTLQLKPTDRPTAQQLVAKMIRENVVSTEIAAEHSRLRRSPTTMKRKKPHCPMAPNYSFKENSVAMATGTKEEKGTMGSSSALCARYNVSSPTI